MFESITDSSSVENKFEFELIALYSFEGAGDSTFKGQKDEGRDHRGGVAQLGEHLLCKQGVIGSNPFISTNFLVGQRKRSSRAEVSSAEKRPGSDCMGS